MSKEQLIINYTEITVINGKTKYIKVNIGDKNMQIPVDESTYVQFQEQFSRPNPSPAQKKKYSTVLKIAEHAFLEGYKLGMERNSQ